MIIKIDKKYFRPNEVEYLKGDASKTYKKLNFRPKYNFEELYILNFLFLLKR